jgi:hypothetical protein
METYGNNSSRQDAAGGFGQSSAAAGAGAAAGVGRTTRMHEDDYDYGDDNNDGHRAVLGSTGSGSSRVNLKRLIRLDQVEEILNHLLEKIDNQDNMIRKLSQQCEQYQSVQLSHKQFQLLQDVCAQLQQQMDQLKIAAMCRVDNDKM